MFFGGFQAIENLSSSGIIATIQIFHENTNDKKVTSSPSWNKNVFQVGRASCFNTSL
jgi:hypothetical protein